MRRLAALIVVALAAPGCEREARRYQELPAAANRERSVRLTSAEPGMPQQQADVKSPYENNAWGIGEGKRLYAAFNCAPCHGVNGGGAIGPALMDDKWIYGSDPENIFATIMEGRPNGMPSFRGKMPEYQAWQIAAYVASLSGMVPKDAAGGRSDNMQVKKQEQSTPDLVPRGQPAEH